VEVLPATASTSTPCIRSPGRFRDEIMSEKDEEYSEEQDIQLWEYIHDLSLTSDKEVCDDGAVNLTLPCFAHRDANSVCIQKVAAALTHPLFRGKREDSALRARLKTLRAIAR